MRKKNNFTEKAGGKFNIAKDNSANSLISVLVAVIFVVLCVMITAVCIFHYCKISPLKNFNRNKTQKQENIMLMPIDKIENNVTIQINVFESYLKRLCCQQTILKISFM
jgi:hypothetical protein